MPKTIYEKPTRELLADMLVDWELKPGQVFTTKRVLEWFAGKYPLLRPGSIRAHLQQAATNDRSRLHHATKVSDDLLFKVASGQFRLYEQDKDPAPIREMTEGDVLLQETEGLDHQDEVDEESESPRGGSEFLLEKDLQRYLAENLQCIEDGMSLYQDEDIDGLEYAAGGGRRIDILALDRARNFVVIELKVSRGYDRVVGQLLRYMNWVRKELAAPGQRVRGIIVCRSISEDLRLACASIGDVELCEYVLSVTVSKVAPLSLG